jgi:hypothetical protein
MDSTKGINKRAFVSCGLFLTGLGLPFSGLINHFLALDPLTAQKHIWMSVHDVLAVLFVFFAVFHVSYNWKSLVKYLKSYSVRIFSKELILASVLIFVLLFAVVFHTFEI